MIAFLDGRFIPEDEARVSIFDRSFQYGDGLFETVRASNGVPFRWPQHAERFHEGARRLQLSLPFSTDTLREHLMELLRRNEIGEAVVRLALSRGVGVRGYSPRGADQPCLAMSVHPMPPLPASMGRWTLCMGSHRLNADDPLTRVKSSNKLIQILARLEAESRGCDEALLLNTRDELCETSSGNLFWLEDNRLHTPAPACGLLPGIARSVVLELATTMGLEPVECCRTIDTLKRADGAFVTMSTRGMIEVMAVAGCPLPRSSHTTALYERYRQLVSTETTAAS